MHVLLQKNFTRGVLIEDVFIYLEPLIFQKILGSHHMWGVSVHYDNFPLIGAGSIDILILLHASKTSLFNRHSGAGGNFEIILDPI